MTAHATDELAALYRAVREQPDDDTLRMALADHLDGLDTVSVPCPTCRGRRTVLRGGRGNGDRFTPAYEVRCDVCKGTGFVPDTSNRDRAALIRVQVELARLLGYDESSRPEAPTSDRL